MAAHRVAGVGEVGLRCAGGVQQCLGVLLRLAVGHAGQGATMTGDMESEGRVGAEAGNDGDAGRKGQAADQAE